MKGCIVFSMIVALELIAAFSVLDDHFSEFFPQHVDCKELGVSSLFTDSKDGVVELRRRGAEKNSKKSKPATTTPTTPRGEMVAGRVDRATPALRAKIRPAPVENMPLPAGQVDRARSTRPANRRGQIHEARPSTTLVREVPDSGATLAHADEALSLGAQHFQFIPKSKSLEQEKFPSSDSMSSQSRLQSVATKGPQEKSISPNRPSTTRRHIERSRSSSSQAGSPTSRLPSPEAPTIPKKSAAATVVASKQIASTSRTPTSNSELLSLPIRQTPNDVVASRSQFNLWLAHSKHAINEAKMEAAIRAPRYPMYPESEATKQIGSEVKQTARDANLKAKELRATAEKDYKDANQVMATEDITSEAARKAFVVSSLSGNSAVLATKAHADAENIAAQKLQHANRWDTIPKHLQKAGLAYQHAVLRNERTKAFQNRYTAGVSTEIAKVTMPDNPIRGEAVVQAVNSQKAYRNQVHLYRDQYKNYQQTQETFSGSESGESETSFSDVARI